MAERWTAGMRRRHFIGGISASDTMTVPRRAAFILTFSIFVFLTAIYIASPIKTPADSRWSIHTAMSLIEGHGSDLSDYMPVLKKTTSMLSNTRVGGRARCFQSACQRWSHQSSQQSL
jgi:hypothetical protein